MKVAHDLVKRSTHLSLVVDVSTHLTRLSSLALGRGMMRNLYKYTMCNIMKTHCWNDDSKVSLARFLCVLQHSCLLASVTVSSTRRRHLIHGFPSATLASLGETISGAKWKENRVRLPGTWCLTAT